MMSCSLVENVLLPAKKAEAFRRGRVVSSDGELMEPGWVMWWFPVSGRTAAASNMDDLTRRPPTTSNNDWPCILAI